MRKKTIIGTILVVFIFSISINAQGKKEQTKQNIKLPNLDPEQKEERAVRYVLPRINDPITLDGLSDESAWEGIESVPVVMYAPNFGDEPTERTEILVAYDDDYLYVAGRLYEREPSKIQAPSKKRDSLIPSNDYFGILIDTFNDKENALGFFTTPLGLRLDFTVFNDAQGPFPVNASWNTFWDVATVRNSDGWFVEMRVPLSSLRFQDKDGHVVMGIITWRYIARKNEVIIFPAIPPNWGQWSAWKPSQAQEVALDDVYSRKPLYIAPYILGGIGQSFELNDAETTYQRIDDPTHEVGLDIKYGLTSNLTLDVTLNTDFAQVEADDQQINLTRFSLFFPEKRLFFQERSSTFEFNFGGPNRLFYSRRIGIYEEESVRIYGGARLVGRIGPWDLGFLSMQTAPIEDLPSENFGVLRIRRQVINPNSYVGVIVTNRIGMDGTYNTAYGLDGIFRLFGDDYLLLRWAQTFENGQENNPASLDPARIRVNWERRTTKGLGYNLSYSRSGPTYNPGIGFELRDNFTRFGNRLLYGWIPGELSPLFTHQVFVNGFLFLRNTDGSIESAEFGPGWGFTTKSGYSGKIAVKLFYEDVSEPFEFSDNADVPVGRYTFYGLNGEFSTPWGRLFNINTTLDAGSFYDGSRVSFDVTPRWNISSSLELSGTYQFNRVSFPARDQQFIAHIARLRVLAMLNTKFSATAFIQYNSATDAVIANIRLRYNPREGNDLYLVYNEGLNTNRYREDPALPFTSSRTVMLKYTYTFNL
ncbi:MAG: DUF5916 domain-containing protein [Candidatus Aminicenantia bacterium]